MARETQGDRRHQTLLGTQRILNSAQWATVAWETHCYPSSKTEGNPRENTSGTSRPTESVWWPGVSAQMDKMIKQCHMCAKEAVAHKEPSSTASHIPLAKDWVRLACLN